MIHVYAYPSGGGAPVFLGTATYGGARPAWRPGSSRPGSRRQDSSSLRADSPAEPIRSRPSLIPPVSGTFTAALTVTVTVQ
jgi:hypothetical protein